MVRALLCFPSGQAPSSLMWLVRPAAGSSRQFDSGFGHEVFNHLGMLDGLSGTEGSLRAGSGFSVI